MPPRRRRRWCWCSPIRTRRTAWSASAGRPTRRSSTAPTSIGYNNRCRRLILPAGPSTLRYDAVVEVSGEPDPVAPGTPQAPVEDLPDEMLVYTLASRYCLTETLSQVAWHLFGERPLGWARVQAVCDWIHINIRYGLLRARR